MKDSIEEDRRKMRLGEGSIGPGGKCEMICIPYYFEVSNSGFMEFKHLLKNPLTHSAKPCYRIRLFRSQEILYLA